jgi:hypothetical protein
VTRETTFPRDDEEYRLIAIYEASRAKEHAAAVQLLYVSPDLPYGAYMKLVSDLQNVRKDCNEQMLAVGAGHNKILDPLSITALQREYLTRGFCKSRVPASA